jgi:hypothetical protein
MRIDKLFMLLSGICPIESLNSDGAIVFSAEATAEQRLAAEAFVSSNTTEVTAEELFDDALQSSINKTYTDVDAIYASAIGNRAPEYEQAEQAALAYQAAGYVGVVSPYVSDYAAAAGITNQQSADLIISRAEGLRAAVLAMRSARFSAQAAMRAATTQAELDAAVASWGVVIAQVRVSLGLK